MSWFRSSPERMEIQVAEDRLAVLRTKRRIALSDLRRALEALEEPEEPEQIKRRVNGKHEPR